MLCICLFSFEEHLGKVQLTAPNLPNNKALKQLRYKYFNNFDIKYLEFSHYMKNIVNCMRLLNLNDQYFVLPTVCM